MGPTVGVNSGVKPSGPISSALAWYASTTSTHHVEAIGVVPISQLRRSIFAAAGLTAAPGVRRLAGCAHFLILKCAITPSCHPICRRSALVEKLSGVHIDEITFAKRTSAPRCQNTASTQHGGVLSNQVITWYRSNPSNRAPRALGILLAIEVTIPSAAAFRQSSFSSLRSVEVKGVVILRTRRDHTRMRPRKRLFVGFQRLRVGSPALPL